MRRITGTISILCLIFLSVFLWSGFAVGARLEKAPDFSLKDIENTQADDVTLSSLEGKIVLLNVFTATCPICRAEFPNLIAVNDRYRNREDVQVVGVAIDPMLEPVKSLVSEIGINYLVLMGELETLVAWQVGGFPTSFLINREGKILKRYEGLHDKSVFLKDIEEIIDEK
ncbi:TlpA family protein disulfide reductase [Acidobacteria bacterium AH-259-D05]|nr:TlpA family protein disulfide reductase [Acidobacteria bacterium AH-259-D05]